MKSIKSAFADHGEVLLLLVLAARVYQPWNAPGLPILDFSELLPQLAAHSSFWGSFRGVTDYLATQGRFSPVQYLYLTATWTAFGSSASGWHWTFFTINAAVLILARGVLLRIGVRRSAALVTLAVWAMMKPFADAWLRPTGETIGLLFLLIAFRAALGYTAAADWRRRTTTIALCAAAAVLSKEMLVVLIPVIWLMTRLQFGDQSRLWAPWGARDTFLTAVLAATVVLVLIPIALVASHAPPGNYAARYGSEMITFAASLDRFEMTLFPGRGRLSMLTHVLADPAWRLLLVLPNLAWLALVADGLTMSSGRKRSWILIIGALWVLAGLIAYSPWPGRAVFYMLPFGFGMVIIAAHALSCIVERGRITAASALIAAAMLAGVTAVEARDWVHQHEMRVELDSSIIHSLSRMNVGSVVAAVPDPVRPEGWGWARKLAEFGRVVDDLPALRSRDVTCAEGLRILADSAGTAVVSGLEGCGMLSPQSRMVRVSAPLRYWPMLFEARRLDHVAFVAGPLR